MKRYLSILLAAVTIFTIGCRKDNTKDNENRDTKASPTMILTATATPTAEVQPSATQEQSSDEAADATPTATIAVEATPSLAPIPSAETAEPTTETPSATQAVSTLAPTLVPSVNPTQTAAPTAKPTVKPTIAPTVKPTVKPTATVTAKPTATVKPIATPTPTPTAKPTFTPYDDAKAQYWVDFAEEYAASIGLRVDDAEEYANILINEGIAELTYGEGWETASWQAIVRESSPWDTPEVVYAKRTQSKIQENLISALDNYKRVGVKYVWVWYEKYDSEYAPTADAYEIYIGYGGLNEN